MSFRDLESGPKGHASKQQPKQRRDEESTFERNIKANIQEMQDAVRKAGDQLENAQRNFLSRRIGESLDKFLERSRELSQETEQLFRDWTVHLAGEPTERHRKKFSYEKLQKAFEEEMVHLKDVARRAVTAQQEALSMGSAAGTSTECRPMCDDQNSSSAVDESEHGLLDDSEACRQAVQEDVTIRNRIAQEREEGIRRIQNQVSEVNQIFRDLASIVHDQGQQFDSIERQAESSCASTKGAVQELKRAVDRQRGTRERLCCMLAAAVVLLCFVILPHMHLLEFNHQPVNAEQAGVAGDISGSSSVGAGFGTGAGAGIGASSSSGSRAVAGAGWRSAERSVSASADTAVAVIKKTGQPLTF